MRNMKQEILAVEYRHMTMPTAYIRVGGHTELAAEQAAKALCVKLKTALPDAVIGMPRFLKNRERGLRVFQVPVTVGCSLTETEALVTEALG